MAGPPGAGKSTFWAQKAQRLAQGALQDADATCPSPVPFVEIDSDYFKSDLIQDGFTQGWIKDVTPTTQELGFPNGELIPMDFASIVHAESNAIFDNTLDKALEAQRPVLLDMVCGHEPSTADRFARLQRHDYTVIVVNLIVDKDTSRQRVHDRWLQAYEEHQQNPETLGPRWVPTEVSDRMFDDTGHPKTDQVIENMVKKFPDVISRQVRVDQIDQNNVTVQHYERSALRSTGTSLEKEESAPANIPSQAPDHDRGR